LADVATGNALISGGVGVAPSYGKIGLTTHVSGVLPVANGGTNASVAGIAAFNNITGYTAAGATGTTSTNLVFSTSPTLVTPVLGTPTSVTLTNATGLPLTTGVTGTLPIGNGGTGQTTASAAFNALSPITSTGDLIIGNGTNSATRLPIGTSGYLLTSNGTTATWTPAPATGVTSFSGGTTGLTPNSPTTGAVVLAGTLATANGGTGTIYGVTGGTF
jgi:hypothetical protein